MSVEERSLIAGTKVGAVSRATCESFVLVLLTASDCADGRRTNEARKARTFFFSLPRVVVARILHDGFVAGPVGWPATQLSSQSL